jgi:hypothetical protein
MVNMLSHEYIHLGLVADQAAYVSKEKLYA